MSSYRSGVTLADALAGVEPLVGPPIMSEIAAVLVEARAHFSDLEEWLIFLNVLAAAQSRSQARTFTAEALLTAQAAAPGGGTNARSIAEASGIPRETVRRKVQRLVDAGLVEWRSGRLHPTPMALCRLEPLRMRIYASAARVWEVVERCRAASLAADEDGGEIQT
ncbi:helix-turn-helix domain-containing protein [Phenylobacterium sp.]|uniref:helix-turn-helix domain-containing protein n=1 Tax=Phenylobacterium sp. TaxID=1871053 RepID=UPI0035B1FB55